MGSGAAWWVNGTFYTGKETIENGRMLVNAQGKIEFLGFSEERFEAEAPVVDLQGATVLPGLIDVHIHGGGGHDLNSDSYEAVDSVSRFFATHGTTSFLATTVSTVDNDVLLRALSNIRSAYDKGVGGADLIGIHLEGPFLNPKRKGAFIVESLRLPNVARMEEYEEASGHLIRLVTMAPELEGGMELVRHLAERGITVSIGHSDALYDEVVKAVTAGASHTTHHFNGMRPLHHREPGVAGAGLVLPELTVELIADGIHVHPAAAKLIFDVKKPMNVCVITDAVQYAGLADGEYGRKTVKDGAIHLTGTDTLAGSSLTMIQALRNVLEFTGLTLAEALPSFTVVPARQAGVLERKGTLEQGKDADFIVVDQSLNLNATVVKGRKVYSNGGAYG